eukprot:2062982-Amphidinium_carterae.2
MILTHCCSVPRFVRAAGAEITCHLEWTHLSLYGQDGFIDSAESAGPQVLDDQSIRAHACVSRVSGRWNTSLTTVITFMSR